MRSQAATRVGICAVNLSALRAVASLELSAASGSYADRAEMPVLSTSIGVVFFGRAFSSETMPAGSFRFAVALSALVCSPSSFLLGGPAVPEEEDHFLEGRVLDEIVDVVATIDETALTSVDETDIRRRNDDVFETASAPGTHGLPSP